MDGGGTKTGREQPWTMEQARELALKSWAAHNTPEARWLKTLRARVACGIKAKKELDELIEKAIRAASPEAP